MINIDVEKLNRQLLSVKKWQFSKQSHGIGNGIGVIVFPTGMGKTFTGGLTVIKYLQANKDAKIIITYPNENLERNWRQGIDDAINHLMAVVDTSNILYISAGKILMAQSIFECDLILVDEFDAFYSDERRKIIEKKSVKYKHIQGFTATPYDNQDKYKEILLNVPIIDTVTEKEAIENNWISQFLEFNLGCRLNENERYQYDFLSEQFSKFKSKFDSDNPMELANNCLRGGEDKKGVYYSSDMWCEAVASRNGWRSSLNIDDPIEKEVNNLWNPKMVKGYASNLYDIIRKRMKLLYNSDTKLKLSIEVLKKFDDLKTICFSQSTEFADKLSKGINDYYKDKKIEKINDTQLFADEIQEVCVTYHSNLEPRMLSSPKTGKLIKFGAGRLKERAIEMIRTNKARIISTASALDKGFDVEDIRFVLESSRTQGKGQRTQRGGRGKRKEFGTDCVVLIVHIYLEDTKDEEWLKNSQEDSENPIYWIKSIDDINHNPKKNYSFDLDL